MRSHLEFSLSQNVYRKIDINKSQAWNTAHRPVYRTFWQQHASSIITISTMIVSNLLAKHCSSWCLIKQSSTNSVNKGAGPDYNEANRWTFYWKIEDNLTVLSIDSTSLVFDLKLSRVLHINMLKQEWCCNFISN